MHSWSSSSRSERRTLFCLHSGFHTVLECPLIVNGHRWRGRFARRPGHTLGVLGMVVLAMVAGAIVTGTALAAPIVRDKRVGSLSTLRPGEVTFRLTIRGDPSPGDSFAVSYRGRGFGDSRNLLCGSVRPCRAGTFSATVSVLSVKLPSRDVSYSFENSYTNSYGVHTTEVFSDSGQEWVPTGRVYSATYTYQHGLPGDQPGRPRTAPSGRPNFVGKIGSVTPGRVAGAMLMGSEHGVYRARITYRTAILERRGDVLVPATYQDLRAEQRVSVWLGKTINLAEPMGATAEAIVIEGPRDSRAGWGTVSSGRVLFATVNVLGLLAAGVLTTLVRVRWRRRARSGAAAFLGTERHGQ